MGRIIKYIAMLLLVSCTKSAQEKPLPVADSFGQTLSYQTRQPFFGITTGETSLVDKEKKSLPTESGQIKNIILLVFNGTTVSNTNWNFNEPTITCEPSGLTTSEQQYILDSVQKDFKYQYNKITTDSNLYNQSKPDARIKIILTTTNFYGAVGGVSYPRSFTWGNDTPGFVFSGLLNYNLKIIRVAVSHEIGHTYGLQHTVEAGGEIMNGQGSAYNAAWIYWGTGHDIYGNNQYDGRNMESVNGGKWDGQMNFKPFGTY